MEAAGPPLDETGILGGQVENSWEEGDLSSGLPRVTCVSPRPGYPLREGG